MSAEKPDNHVTAALIELGFLEDFGSADPAKALDLTTFATVGQGAKSKAALVLKQKATVACLDIFETVLRRLDPTVKVEVLFADGTHIDVIPTTVAKIEGSTRALLMGERLALNLVQRLFGVATQTRTYTEIASGSGIAILDTRKTTPGLRALEKRAVLCGGGTNHRMGLYDAIMIKDNHIAATGSITEALKRVRAYLLENPAKLSRPIQVEVADMQQLDEALKARAEAVLLDNMSPDQVREAVKLIRAAGRGDDLFVEVSGGVNLSTLKTYLIDGVSAISIGALTHSVSNVDLSLEF